MQYDAVCPVCTFTLNSRVRCRIAHRSEADTHNCVCAPVGGCMPADRPAYWHADAFAALGVCVECLAAYIVRDADEADAQRLLEAARAQWTRTYDPALGDRAFNIGVPRSIPPPRASWEEEVASARVLVGRERDPGCALTFRMMDIMAELCAQPGGLALLAPMALAAGKTTHTHWRRAALGQEE